MWTVTPPKYVRSNGELMRSAWMPLPLDGATTLDWTVASLCAPRIVAVLAATAASGPTSNDWAGRLTSSTGAMGWLSQAARTNAIARNGAAGDKQRWYRGDFPDMTRINAPSRSFRPGVDGRVAKSAFFMTRLDSGSRIRATIRVDREAVKQDTAEALPA